MSNEKSFEELEKAGKIIIENKWDGIKIYALDALFKSEEKANLFASAVTSDKELYMIIKVEKENSILDWCWGVYGLIVNQHNESYPTKQGSNGPTFTDKLIEIKDIDNVLNGGILLKLEHIKM